MTLSLATDNLNNAFLLDNKDLLVAKSKRGQHNQLVFAVMLKFFEINQRFPNLQDTMTNPMNSQNLMRVTVLMSAFVLKFVNSLGLSMQPKLTKSVF